MKALRVGTRGSALALAQTRAILDTLRLTAGRVRFEEVVIKTTGDRWSEKNEGPLPPGKGIFTAEIEQALLTGEIDVAVHSLKDLPVEMRPELTIGAFPQREDPRDALITKAAPTLEDLPYGGTVATGSLRRRRQLQRVRPDLACADIRGNIDTRLRKLRENDGWSGIILAAAGIRRLRPNLESLRFLPLEPEFMLPAPGQGALALQIRADDEVTRLILGGVHDEATACAVTAERAFLAATGGGCQWPLGSLATITATTLSLRGIFWAEGEDKPRLGSREGRPADATRIGRELAEDLLK